MFYSPTRNLVTIALAVLVFPGPALAGWNPDGVVVTPTTDNIPLIEACSDGAYGTFVAWQQVSIYPGRNLRVSHLLPSGDVDPLWPTDGAIACSVSVNRSWMGVLPDRLGGVYVWWLEGLDFYVTRLVDGAIEPDWPTRGRMIGTLGVGSARPDVIEDGAHGIFAAWTVYMPIYNDPFRVWAVHLGPSNSGAGGWPEGPRQIVPSHDWPVTKFGPRLALASDGGLFVAWATCSADTIPVPSRFHLGKRTTAGLLAPGWPAEGVDVGPFNCTFEMEWPPLVQLRASPLDLSADGRGGVFFARWDPEDWTVRVDRFQSDGSPADGWTGGGYGYAAYRTDVGPDADLRVAPDDMDGALAGAPFFFDHGSDYDVSGFSPSGDSEFLARGWMDGFEFVSNDRGGVFAGEVNCCGPSGMYSPCAFLGLEQSPAPPGWTNLFEIDCTAWMHWYGDIGLAPTGDGGIVFFWSQVQDRVGLFARRYGPTGPTTAVTNPPQKLELRTARFVSGSGIHVWVATPDGEPNLIELFDVAGRKLATDRFGPGVTGERVLSGTRALQPGLFFLRLSAGREAVSAKVVVTR